ncbi:hypothetical protein L249_6521 [Ophiocordyceps polyrhachis-furcata BCC 54312]|uniref:tRNA pseudouridine synthase 1 n=1 Tax=Ophiocordyceps polyrhachis-furcata BCC 54312 TaxID=1330021 RepID=A0A367LLQ7_9HYPO|nr:hypothetical protein L249_6521 [Ophiocordyceps polyrhachis-furcata BCC 54312]
MNSQTTLEPFPDSSPVSNTYASSESTASVCSTTQRQPPAYGDEPPNYQEELLSQAKARERKTIFIRLLSSIFITVLVSLIVAAVVERIHDNRGDVHHEVPTRSVEKITVISTQASSASPDAAAAKSATATSDSPPLSSAQTTGSKAPTDSASAAAAATSTQAVTSTIDCSSMSLLSGASLVTTFRQQESKRNGPPVPMPTAGESRMQDKVVYSFRGCLWSEALYRLGDRRRDGMSRLCTVMCPSSKAGEAMPDGLLRLPWRIPTTNLQTSKSPSETVMMADDVGKRRQVEDEQDKEEASLLLTTILGSRQQQQYKQKKKQEKKRKRQEEQGDWREMKRRKVDAAEPKNPFSKEEIAAETRRPKRKVAVMIGYAGTGYKGMQVNGDEPTIERDLFQAFIDAAAISKANADDPRKSSLARCARTDKGVHAAGNVISLKLIIEDEAVVANINARLPDQIRVWGIQRTNNTFNCYQYCDSRWYEYLLPSYCLLPPHPHTFLGRKLVELAAEHGATDELRATNADVADFWSEVETEAVRPILDALDPDVRAAVLERAHAGTDNDADVAAVTAPETNTDASPPSGPPPPPESVKPKNNRQLGPVDFALRDIKAAYVTAKRRYRISPERLGRLQAALDRYLGTNNFHNYTVQKPYGDASARRHIKSFVANPEPIIIGGTEWLSLKVHGQSFMMHQIRKMVGMATLLVRCGTPLDRINDSYADRKLAIPKAPGLGLLLERPVFENYNRRARESLDRPVIDFGNYEEEMKAFKDKHIYTRIFDVEEKENTQVLFSDFLLFHSFFNQVDQFKSNHFLWLTAGGLSIAEIPKSAGNKVEEDVDKQLGDENEDPEGGEG